MVQNWPQVVIVRIILGLLAGGTMSLAGAAVLARQWLITRGHRPH